jgi:hypothetical protein
MKFTVSLLLTALLAFALCLFLPWWAIALAAFAVAVAIPQKPFRAFGAGFLGLLLLWGGLSFWMSSTNGHILARKMGQLILGAPVGPWVMIVITGLIGSLVGGLAGLAGSFVRGKKVNAMDNG